MLVSIFTERLYLFRNSRVLIFYVEAEMAKNRIEELKL